MPRKVTHDLRTGAMFIDGKPAGRMYQPGTTSRYAQMKARRAKLRAQQEDDEDDEDFD